MSTKHAFVGVAAAVLACTVAVADEDGGTFSGNITITSDYSFRGVSQTNLLPAVQGGFDYEMENGFSFGTWASNVNFGDNTSQELDLYMGYGMDLNDTTSLSFSLLQFEYPGEGDNLDYQEFQASLDISSISLGFAYSPSYVGVDDWTFTYFSAGYSATLGENVSFGASVGINSADKINDDDDSYIDYSVGIGLPIAGIDLGVQVVGTDMDDVEAAEGRLIVSLSKSL